MMKQIKAMKLALEALEGADRIDCDMRDAINALQEALAEQPAQRKPLTVEKILHLVDTYVGAPSMAYPLDSSDWINFARAIEAAHGITNE